MNARPAFVGPLVVAIVAIGGAVSTTAAQDGIVEGRVRAGSHGIPNVVVDVLDAGVTDQTDADGRFRLSLAGGVYTLAFRFERLATFERNVVVMAGETVTLDEQVESPLFYEETVTVVAPSLLPERILETSAAVTTLLGSDVRLQAADAQVPRILAFTPGAEVTQSGVYDFNVNARGFNTATNRHVKTLIDGRDPSVPVLLGYQDWAANAFALDELEQAEFIRGPAAALYGAGAFNGVLSITTKAPADSPGGYARFAFGGLDTARVDVRHASRMSASTAFKVTGGYYRSHDFARSRVSSVDYPGLPPEVIPLPRDTIESVFGTARLDRTFASGRTGTIEFGTTQVKGLTTVTSAGRTQATENHRPWARGAYQSSHWRGSIAYSGQHTDNQIGLSTGTPIYFDADNLEGNLQGHGRFLAGRGQVVAGISVGTQHADSADPGGAQTVFRSVERVTRGGGFAQVDYKLSNRLRGLFATRVDDSNVHTVQWSPRGALVWQISDSQTLRGSIGRAFQSPSLPEFFLWTPVAPPVDLSALETTLAPALNGASLGFGRVPVVAAGNAHLGVEKISSVEIGYTTVLRGRVFATVDYYRARLSDFTSNLLPQQSTPLGVINPDYAPYQPPPSLPAASAAAVLAALDTALPPLLRASMTNDEPGKPAFVVLSDRNLGRAHTQGVEATASIMMAPGLRVDGALSLFDYRIDEQAALGTVHPNTPSRQWSAGVIYTSTYATAALRFRSVAAFSWSSGLFTGPVPAYQVTDVQALVPLTHGCSVGVDVTNLFNDVHYEIFGGDRLRRRALGSIRYAW
jgi:iron complex outermembrane receptor protein